jgi:ferredoxin
MDAIGKDFKSTNNLECINCMDCQTICPEHAIHFGFGGEMKSVRFDLTRRKILGTGLAGLFSAALIKVHFSDPKKRGKLIRPPGAREENQFLDYCIRCGACIRVCSTAGKGLQYTGLEAGWEALWTPMIFPETGYCEYNCNLCGQVCPTHAITSLSLEEKKQLKIGTAHFDKTRCIPWYYGENCMVCEEHCPLPDKAIKFRKESIKTIDGKQSEVLLPYVDESLCIGCGICVTRCPVEGDRGIFLTNTGEERWIG